MSGNHTTESDSLGAGSVTPPGRDKFDAWFDTPAATTVRQLEAAHERIAELVTEGNGLRALLGVILDDFEASDRRPARMQFDRYRELGGITPAAATAGTEHLAAAITRLAIPDEEG